MHVSLRRGTEVIGARGTSLGGPPVDSFFEGPDCPSQNPFSAWSDSDGESVVKTNSAPTV